MSSEYSIHLHDKPVQEQVRPLYPGFPTVAVGMTIGGGLAPARIVLYVPNDRLMGVSLLFHRIALELGELANAYADDIGAVPATIPAEDAAESLDPQGHRWG